MENYEIKVKGEHDMNCHRDCPYWNADSGDDVCELFEIKLKTEDYDDNGDIYSGEPFRCDECLSLAYGGDF